MKNKSGFYTRSAACCQVLAGGSEAVAFRCSERAAWGVGVEWHHGGSGVIAFFPKDEEERQRVNDLRQEQAGRKIKSKVAAVRYLRESAGAYKIPYKAGKYGEFFNFWGDPDGYFYIDPEDPNLDDIKQLLDIK